MKQMRPMLFIVHATALLFTGCDDIPRETQIKYTNVYSDTEWRFNLVSNRAYSGEQVMSEENEYNRGYNIVDCATSPEAKICLGSVENNFAFFSLDKADYPTEYEIKISDKQVIYNNKTCHRLGIDLESQVEDNIAYTFIFCDGNGIVLFSEQTFKKDGKNRTDTYFLSGERGLLNECRV